MRYSVVWLPGATNELARIWLDAFNRDEISSAANSLDAALARAPLDHGEARDTDMRVVFSGRLGVEYRVSDADRMVQVCAVWLIK
jgi:hypothetical protein